MLKIFQVHCDGMAFLKLLADWTKTKRTTKACDAMLQEVAQKCREHYNRIPNEVVQRLTAILHGPQDATIRVSLLYF